MHTNVQSHPRLQQGDIYIVQCYGHFHLQMSLQHVIPSSRVFAHLCVPMIIFLILFNQEKDFHDTWYEHRTARGHLTLYSVIY